MTLPPQRIIDTKLPLTWLIGCATLIIATLFGFMLTNNSNADKMQAKLDLLRADQATLILNTAKLEKRVDDRDTRTDALKETQYAQQRVIDTHTLRIESLERRQK